MAVSPRPLIAVTGRTIASGRITNWRTGALASPLPYVEALHRGGATAAVLLPEPLDAGDAAGRIRYFDGVLLTGGGDIDPARYGEAPASEVYGVDADADAFELALLAAATEAGKPVLAICRGLQVVNVAHGGTLDQHITGRPGLGDHGVPGVSGASNAVQIDARSELGRATASTVVSGRCHHHQAVAEVGAGLRVTARSADGVIEGLEADPPGPWLVAVQWHPEDTAAEDPSQQRIFDALVAEAAAAAAGLRLAP